MTCFGWCFERDINWDAWGVFVTLLAVGVALFLPERERCKQKQKEEAARAAREIDGATIMIPIVEEAVRKLRGMEPTLASIGIQRNFQRGDQGKVVIHAFDEMKEMQTYADALPEEPRRLFAQAVGWGTSWNGLARTLPNPTMGNTDPVQTDQLQPFRNLLPSLIKVFDSLNTWAIATGSKPVVEQAN